MRMTNILIAITISIFSSISCNNETNNNSKYFWIIVNISKELLYNDILVNDISYEENKSLREEYSKNTNIHMFDPEHSNFKMFFFKFPSNFTVDDLKNYKIEIKNNDELIWRGVAYNENDFSKCGFYQMKDEPNKNKIKLIDFNFIEKDKDNKLILEGKYYADSDNKLICDKTKKDKVMIAVNIANNIFDNDYIKKINGINVDNGIENNYIWHNFRELLESSGLSALYLYHENQDGFGKSSSYWSLMVDRNELKNYKLEFLSKSGKKTIKNLNEIQFCGVPNEKSFDELIDNFKILTYGFTIKDGKTKIEFQGALNNNNRMVNCSKIDGETSGIAFMPFNLLKDRKGDINITKYNGNNIDYNFTDNWVNLYYYNVSAGNPDEYKKQGLKRWGLTIETHYTSNTEDGFYMLIPWHLVKEGETLTITSDTMEEQIENEKTFFSSLLHSLYYSSGTGISFSENGSPIIDYGNYQEITYYFNKIPKKYGDILDINFHILAKQDEEVVLDYEGTINSRYFGEDIFQCFNKDKLWICPQDGFEENYPWID